MKNKFKKYEDRRPSIPRRVLRASLITIALFWGIVGAIIYYFLWKGGSP
jgi:hypothetical protein